MIVFLQLGSNIFITNSRKIALAEGHLQQCAILITMPVYNVTYGVPYSVCQRRNDRPRYENNYI